MIKKNTALKMILGISIAGLIFSGYLSYSELLKQTCLFGGCTNLLGLPVCIYGFFIYLAILIFSILGIISKK